MALKHKFLFRRIAQSLGILLLLVVAFTVYANLCVEKYAENRIFSTVCTVPHNRVALLLGTSPLNRYGRPNSYFTNRIVTAAELYHAGKVDYIIASGDNHTKQYNEPSAMRDSLIAQGVPADRIILDFAGFRTLDSVVRAKEVFGCDSLTIISQDDHSARALYLAEANGIQAVAISAPIRAGRRVRVRLALREWLARYRMMLDIWFGKRPHFLGDKIEIPNVPMQRSYSTADGMTIKILNPSDITASLDSLVVEFRNTRDVYGMTGEWFEITKLDNGVWQEVPCDNKYTDENGETVCFNSIGYIVLPDTTFRITVKPWFYEKPFTPGIYRLAKRFDYPPYPRNQDVDTAYVEFEIR